MNIRMVLRSCDSVDMYGDNKPYDFIVHLSSPLSLSGYWTISLAEFSLIGHNSRLASQPELFLCSNVCDDNIVGGIKMPLLRRIYFEKPGNIIYHVPYEVRVKQGQLQDIHLYLRNEKNEPASFIRGQVCVTLLLKRLPFH